MILHHRRDTINRRVFAKTAQCPDRIYPDEFIFVLKSLEKHSARLWPARGGQPGHSTPMEKVIRLSQIALKNLGRNTRPLCAQGPESRPTHLRIVEQAHQGLYSKTYAARAKQSQTPQPT